MKKGNRSVIIWLLIGCALIFIMVLVGGITRLTHSGLSISNYKLISGTIPPMNQVEWQEAFDLYKQYPEYQKLNTHFTLQDFRDIYFWEWLHRVLGRLIGIVFIVPFLYFLIKKRMTKSTVKKTLGLLALGAFQGFMGWYMVKSGLVDRPDVSHYRLAAHLITAFVTFVATFWVALDLMFPNKKEVDKKFRNLIGIGLIVLILQITWGAFVAGLDAGLVHNHWPLMNEGVLVHETVWIEHRPLWKNFVEGRSGVQFVHRYLAYIVVAFTAFIWYRSRKMTLTSLQKNGITGLLAIVLVQFLLGILTLVYSVPVWLGVAHQIFAFILLGNMTFVLHRFSK